MANDVNEPPSEVPRSRGMIPADELPFKRNPIKWRIWIPLAAILVSAVVIYFVVDARRARRERDALLREHAMLTESLAPPYRAVRARIERLAHGAAGAWQGTYTAPGFSMAQLLEGPVLYGRIRIPEIRRAEDVIPSIRHRYPDQIGSCMGVESTFVYDYYRRGDFLMPSYVDSVRNIANPDRLRALRSDLEGRLRADTTNIVEWTRRRYLMLAVDEAAVSTAGATRLYVYDLRNEQVLFRMRDAGEGTVIIPFRIAGLPGGGRPVPQPTGAFTQSQHDCAVAAAARQLLGAPTSNMPSAPAVAPAAAGDAGAQGATPSSTDGGAAQGATPAGDAATTPTTTTAADAASAQPSAR